MKSHPLFKILFLLLFLLQVRLEAETTFERAYGNGSNAQGVFFKQTPDSGFVIVGNNIDSVNNTHGYYVLKIDAAGNVLWENTYADGFSSYAYSLTILPDSNIAIIGTHAGVVYQDLAEVVVMNQSGNILRSQTFPPNNGWGTSGVAIVTAPDSGAAIVIYTDGFVGTNYYSLYRLNSDMTYRWGNFTGFDGSFMNSHDLTSNRNHFFSLSYYDYFFYSATPQFRVTEVRKFNDSHSGGVDFDTLYNFDCETAAIEKSNDGGAIIIGTDDLSGQQDVCLIKIDANANVIWRKTIGGTRNEKGFSVKETQDGGYIMLASIPDSVLTAQRNLLMIKTDQNGDSLWSREFGGVFDEEPLHIEQTFDGGYAILGATNSYGNKHIYFVKTDSTGNSGSSYQIASVGTYFCQGDSVHLQLTPNFSGESVRWSTGDTTASIYVFSSGNYFAQIINASGDTSVTNQYPVFFSSNPSVNISNGGDTINLCEGSLLQNTDPTEVTFEYTWQHNADIIFTTDNYIYIFQPGLYTLSVSNYCGVDADSLYINNVYSLPVLPSITVPLVDAICEGDSLRLSYIPQSNETLQWNFLNNSAPTPIIGATDTVLYASVQGFYAVEATNSFRCKIMSDPVFVSVDDQPYFISANGRTSFCIGGDVTLSVDEVTGSNFLWSNGDTSNQIIVDTSGLFYVSFIDDYGCPKWSDTVSVEELPNPLVNIGADTILCTYNPLILSPGTFFNSYSWSTGSMDPSITVNFSGIDTDIISVFAVDTNGCGNSDTLTITYDVCTGISSVLERKINIYPNPIQVGEQFKIEADFTSELEISIYSSDGRLVLNRKRSSLPAFIESTALIPGLYTVIVGTGTERYLGRLFIR